MKSFLSGWIVTWPTKLIGAYLARLGNQLGRGVVLVRANEEPRAEPGTHGSIACPFCWERFCCRHGPPERLGTKPLYDPGNAGTYILAIVVLLGISFTWWARIHLGRFWSNAITRKEGHSIVELGPYGLVRHPIYTGLILAILATGAAVATVASLLGAVLISFGEWQKARMEERFLSAELGAEAYQSYSRRVPMIVPFFRF